ncbi:MAG: carbohydrate ABC transporter permease [Clostridia bacterium]|nr:carbohydrate ABC transporter permease [Clostridia bacterium]
MAEKEQIYNSQNFRPNKQKVLKPPIGCYIIISIYSLYILMPLYIIVITSFKNLKDASSEIFLWWPVSGFSVNAYVRAIESDGPMLVRGLLNTVWYYVPRTIVALFINMMGAYGFGKLDWRGKDAIFAFLMLTMMIPGSITMTAGRMYMAMLGWSNTWYPIVIPSFFGGIGGVFFLRQYVKAIPDDLIGAAKIDGMSEIRIFLTLVIPLCRAALTARFITAFIGAYNGYLDALIYLGNNEQNWTIQLVLKDAITKYPGEKYITMAYTVIGMFPLIIIYIFIQDLIVKGSAITSGLKG